MKHKTFKGENCDKNKLTTPPPELLKYPILSPALLFSFYTLALLKNIRICWNIKKFLKYFILSLKALKNRRGGGAGWRNFFLEDTGCLTKHNNRREEFRLWTFNLFVTISLQPTIAILQCIWCCYKANRHYRVQTLIKSLVCSHSKIAGSQAHRTI